MAPRKGHPRWGKSEPRPILSGLPQELVDEVKSIEVAGATLEDLSPERQTSIRRKLQNKLRENGVFQRKVERSDKGTKRKHPQKERSDKGKPRPEQRGIANVKKRWNNDELGVVKTETQIAVAASHLPSLTLKMRERLMTNSKELESENSPIGFLVCVMNGRTGYEADMKWRIQAAKCLADKCMPDLRTVEEHSMAITGTVKDYTTMSDSVLETLIANRITENGRTRRTIARITETETSANESDSVHRIDDAEFSSGESTPLRSEEVGRSGVGEDS